jgi:hypothetical protein
MPAPWETIFFSQLLNSFEVPTGCNLILCAGGSLATSLLLSLITSENIYALTLIGREQPHTSARTYAINKSVHRWDGGN